MTGMQEKLAALSVLLVLFIVPGSIFWYEHHTEVKRPTPETKVFEITGFAGTGSWTLETVNGINYWWKQFEPMTLLVDIGDPVILRLQSADLFHQFYVPALNIGPIDVKPGHPVEVSFKATKAGIYQYYCTSMCGGCHFYMTGWIVITPKGEKPVAPPPIICPICVPDFVERPKGDLIELGEYLFLKKGCVTCHGNEGRGGVKNYNYAKDTVPAHNTTAEKLFLEEEEEAQAFIEFIKRNENIDNPDELPDIPRVQLVLARYKAAKELVKNGSNSVKFDPEGPTPPLQMPTWKAQLPDRDIDALLLYFIDLYDWESLDEEDEDYEDDEGLMEQ